MCQASSETITNGTTSRCRDRSSSTPKLSSLDRPRCAVLPLYVNPATPYISQTGYIPFPTANYEQATQRLNGGQIGTVFTGSGSQAPGWDDLSRGRFEFCREPGRGPSRVPLRAKQFPPGAPARTRQLAGAAARAWRERLFEAPLVAAGDGVHPDHRRHHRLLIFETFEFFQESALALSHRDAWTRCSPTKYSA